jgi:hypothetical protein
MLLAVRAGKFEIVHRLLLHLIRDGAFQNRGNNAALSTNARFAERMAHLFFGKLAEPFNSVRDAGRKWAVQPHGAPSWRSTIVYLPLLIFAGSHRKKPLGGPNSYLIQSFRNDLFKFWFVRPSPLGKRHRSYSTPFASFKNFHVSHSPFILLRHQSLMWALPRSGMNT